MKKGDYFDRSVSYLDVPISLFDSRAPPFPSLGKQILLMTFTTDLLKEIKLEQLFRIIARVGAFEINNITSPFKVIASRNAFFGAKNNTFINYCNRSFSFSLMERK